MKKFLSERWKDVKKHLWSFIKNSLQDPFTACIFLMILCFIPWTLLGEHYIRAFWYGIIGAVIFVAGIYFLLVITTGWEPFPHLNVNRLELLKRVLSGQFRRKISLSSNSFRTLQQPPSLSSYYARVVYFWFILFNSASITAYSIIDEVKLGDVVEERAREFLNWILESLTSLALELFVLGLQILNDYFVLLILIFLLAALSGYLIHRNRNKKQTVRN